MGAVAIHRTFVLAGYVASEPVWADFIPDWQHVLDLPPTLAYFKMSKAESLKGEFEGWSAGQRDERLEQFIEVSLKHEPGEAAIAVPAKDYNEILYPLLPRRGPAPITLRPSG